MRTQQPNSFHSDVSGRRDGSAKGSGFTEWNAQTHFKGIYNSKADIILLQMKINTILRLWDKISVFSCKRD
jgi:hypothetical protein